MNLNKKMDDFKNRCKDAGLKITPQRMAIYKILVQSKKHPSAEMVHKIVKKELPHISLDTVNRTLLTLSDIGQAFIVEGSGDAKRFDAQLKNHQHFKCVKCKSIIDFHHKDFDNIKIPASIKRKYKVLRKTVFFEGLCDSCK